MNDNPEIRYLGDMQRLQPQPGDVFVVTTDMILDGATCDRLAAHLSGQLGGAKVIVLCEGLKLSVVAAPAPQLRIDAYAGSEIDPTRICSEPGRRAP